MKILIYLGWSKINLKSNKDDLKGAKKKDMLVEAIEHLEAAKKLADKVLSDTHPFHAHILTFLG